jgi:type VI protein secretion system component VasK
MRRGVVLVWSIGLLLAAAAGWLIWSRGSPYLPPSWEEQHRFAAALAPLVVWALLPVLLWRLFTRNTALPPSLKENSRAAIAFLSKRGIRGKRGRARVPFFLVMGPPGSGKSSLIEKSDLRIGMPAAIGKTTLWVGADAVFAEAAVDDADDIVATLSLLQAVRPDLPVNAALVVLSPADLTLADPGEQRQRSEALADALNRLDAVLHARVPSYLLLSKTDLVPGFREFFDRYEPQEREQPWGFLLPLGVMAKGEAKEARTAAIDHGFDDILGAMRMRHMEWLARETDPLRSGHLQVFPANVAALQRTITPLLDRIAPEPERDRAGIILRGVFLTSARQEPLSIDALLPEMSRRFALPRMGMLPPDLGLDEEDHSYFIKNVISRIVLPEAGLVLRNRARSVGRALGATALVASLVLVAGAAVLLFHTLDRQYRLADATSDAVAGLRPVPVPATPDDIGLVLANLRGLERIRQKTAGPEQDYVGWTRLGVRPELLAALAGAERRLRVNMLTPHLAARLESQLVDRQASVETLKARLAVAEAATEPQSDVVETWLEDHAATLGELDEATLRREGPMAIREAGGLRIDPAYIDAARRLIAYKENVT